MQFVERFYFGILTQPTTTLTLARSTSTTRSGVRFTVGGESGNRTRTGVVTKTVVPTLMNPNPLIQKALNEFDEKFSGQTELSQAILGTLEYRGFNDAGKYIDDDISKAIVPILKSFLQTELEAVIRETRKCIPEEKGRFGDDVFIQVWNEGWNACRAEMLRRLGDNETTK